MVGNQDGRVGLITGASRGIGLAIAQSLHEVCDSLALVSSSESSFPSELRRQFGDSVSFYAADFSNLESINELAKKLSVDYSKFDIFINNAGLYNESPLSEASFPSISSMIDVNIKAPILLTKLLLDKIKEGHNSIIINISSEQATSPSPNLATYAATKSALSTFSEALRQELNPIGIRVTTIEPSGVNTWGALDSKSLLKPEDIGSLVKYIVNFDSSVQLREIALSAV